jgi:flagellin FlaB
MRHIPRARRGVTGLETAIILVAFVIIAAAFSFMLLNIGFLTSQKTQTVSASSGESTTTLQVVDAVVGGFQLSDNQSRVNMTSAEFYLRLPGGGDTVDLSDSKLTITYTNVRCLGVIFPPNGTVVTLTCVNGDDDHLLEQGEIFKVYIDLSALRSSMVDPSTTSAWGLYPHPYEWWQITLKPSQGGAVTIRRTLGAINKTVEALY